MCSCCGFLSVLSCLFLFCIVLSKLDSVGLFLSGEGIGVGEE